MGGGKIYGEGQMGGGTSIMWDGRENSIMGVGGGGLQQWEGWGLISISGVQTQVQ